MQGTERKKARLLRVKLDYGRPVIHARFGKSRSAVLQTRNTRKNKTNKIEVLSATSQGPHAEHALA